MSFSNTCRRNIIIALILVLVLSLSLAVACAETHVCKDVCAVCGLCMSECEDEICAEKCPGNHNTQEAHYCYSACEICGLCTSDCLEEVCKTKCAKNHSPEMYVTYGNVRVGLLSDTLIRIEVKGAKGFENRNTYYISNRTDWEVPEHTQSVSGQHNVITTENYKVYIPEGATTLKGVYVTSAEGENLLWEYQGETTSNVYLPSPSDELKSWYFTDSPRIVPSDYGYSYNAASNDPLQGWDFNNDADDCFVFLPDGDYKQFCQDYVNLTGKSEMVSLQMLGYWDSRWVAYSSETALQQIKDYTDRGYSLDVLVIDKDWHSDNGIDGVGYEVNTELFPNMREFLDQCHELGVNIMFNDHPEPVKGTGNILDKDEVGYRDQKLTMILSLGLDYWWYDRNWSVSLNKVDPDISVYAFGMYAFQWVTNEYLESITDLNEYAKRALIMGNVDGCLHGKWMYASDISAHKYSIQWTGDIGTDTTALSQEIYATVFGGAEVGLPYMSSDLGGHTAAVSNDMYIRWLQYGALSTICRVHCTNVDQIGQDGRMPWLFGETAEEVVHEYVDMRYRLLPLYYSLARENYDTGLPIMRRTDIMYPQYAEASRNDQYMLGDNILIAPLDSAEQLEKVPVTWLQTPDFQPGLKATYFNGNDLKNVYKTKTDETIFFNWENGGAEGMGADLFSVRWEGVFTVRGTRDARLCFFADDGVRVWVDGQLVVDGWDVYDTLLYTPYYTQGTTHNLKVEYREDYGGAHIYMYYGERNEDGEMMPNTRTVFIPDGTWVDVWTGERFTGPQTITVSHGITTSPIFVREGAVFALAENMVNTSAKDWSKMALDIYAGKESTKTNLYEDDTNTQAYKHGKYRNTLITSDYADGKITVTVNPAEGAFDGARAFDTRNWTVRIHYNPEWGSLKTLKLNGKTVTEGLLSFKQTDDASPFAFEGAALDGNIYQFNFSGNVYEKQEIVFGFTKDITSPDAPEYDASKTDVDIEIGESGDSLNLTEAGSIDWAYFGAEDVTTVARKNTEKSLIGDLGSYSTCSLLSNSYIYTVWSDGAGVYENIKGVASGLISYKDFSLNLKVDTTRRFYVLNLGGEQCTVKLTVRDRAGNARTVTFGDLNGVFRNRIVISAQGEAESEIYVTYAVVASKPDGTGTFSKVWISSVYVTDEVKDPVYVDYSKVSASVTAEEIIVSTTVNLTTTAEEELEVLDWRHYGATEEGPYVSKDGGDSIEKVSFTNGQAFYDYKAGFVWSDGEQIENSDSIVYDGYDPAHGTTHGTCSFGDIQLSVRVDANTKKIILYTGVWKATNTVIVYNSQGTKLCTLRPFAAGDTSVCKAVEIEVNSEIETVLNIKIERTGGGDGNVSLTGIQVLGVKS